jgi:hypothetical protein
MQVVQAVQAVVLSLSRYTRGTSVILVSFQEDLELDSLMHCVSLLPQG